MPIHKSRATHFVLGRSVLLANKSLYREIYVSSTLQVMTEDLDNHDDAGDRILPLCFPPCFFMHYYFEELTKHD